jgi:hypothetical protein
MLLSETAPPPLSLFSLSGGVWVWVCRFVEMYIASKNPKL